MRLEELMNQYSDRLSETDLYIWDYVEKHKKQCENMTIEQLAAKCSVSRTTILRFTKKLSLKGFGEFKVHLKMENDDGKQQVSKAVQVCMSYEAMMQDMIQQDFREIIEAIYQAERVFVYGTGMVQRTVAKEMKRLFYHGRKNFFDFNGGDEFKAILKELNGRDLLIIISVSGERTSMLDFVKRAKIKNVPVISMTERLKNPLAELSDYNLYISTTLVEQKLSHVEYKSMTSYFMLIEMLILRYLEYLEGKEGI